MQRIGQLHDGDVATVLVLGSSVRSFEATDSAGMRSLTDRSKTLALPGGCAHLNNALSLTSNLVLPDMDNQVVVITDGAVSADPSVVATVGAPIELLQVGRASAANLTVVEMNAKASSANANGTAPSPASRTSAGTDANATVSVLADGVEVQSQNEPIPARRWVDFTSDALPTGVSRLRLELRPLSDDVLPADNGAELVLARDSDLAQRILLVSDTPLVLQRALSALPGSQVTTISTTEHLSGNIEGGPFDLLVFEDYTPASASDITTRSSSSIHRSTMSCCRPPA